MILIDGSNAGGQLVRTAVALSALTGKPFKITNIRGARPEPGLKTQHIEGIKSIGELCSAEIKGLELGSKEIEFYPKEFKEKNLKIRISTAGSIGLVLQALLIASLKIKKPIEVEFEGGGTWGKWAPPVIYIERVFLPLVGQNFEIESEREGFYPKGGARLNITIEPCEIKKINYAEKSKLKSINIVSIASSNLQKSRVAERQAEGASKFVEEKLNITPSIEINYSDTLSTGSGILCFITTQNSIIGADNIGEIGKRAEQIGERAARDLLKEYFNGVIDQHAADMLLPYMAFSNQGEILTSKITNHILTNIDVIETFLNVKFEVKGEKGKPGRIRII